MTRNILRTKDGRMCHLTLIRQPPARRHVMRDGRATKALSAWAVLACAAVFAVCAFAMIKW